MCVTFGGISTCGRKSASPSAGMHPQRASTQWFFVVKLLLAGGEECEQGVEARDRFIATEKRHHLKEARTGRAAGQSYPHTVNKVTGFDAPLGCRSTHHSFHMWLIEWTC